MVYAVSSSSWRREFGKLAGEGAGWRCRARALAGGLQESGLGLVVFNMAAVVGD